MTVRVMVHARVQEQDQPEFEAAFAQVRQAVAGTPGHLADELLHSKTDPTAYVLLSHWESRERFLAWEDAPIHRQLTTPMRPYWSGPVDRLIFDVAV
jgi:heme oxygenase (mycobilin-producing)